MKGPLTVQLKMQKIKDMLVQLNVSEQFELNKRRKENIEKLTYAEVVNIVDGQVLGGREGLHKTLNKFVIGAMKLEAMMRYTEAGIYSLLVTVPMHMN